MITFYLSLLLFLLLSPLGISQLNKHEFRMRWMEQYYKDAENGEIEHIHNEYAKEYKLHISLCTVCAKAVSSSNVPAVFSGAFSESLCEGCLDRYKGHGLGYIILDKIRHHIMGDFREAENKAVQIPMSHDTHLRMIDRYCRKMYLRKATRFQALREYGRRYNLKIYICMACESYVRYSSYNSNGFNLDWEYFCDECLESKVYINRLLDNIESNINDTAGTLIRSQEVVKTHS